MSEERLTKIELGLARCVTLLENMEKMEKERAAGAKEWRVKIDHLLYGKNGTPGQVVRLDRLEQAHERQKWFVRLVAAKVLILILGALWAMLVK